MTLQRIHPKALVPNALGKAGVALPAGVSFPTQRAMQQLGYVRAQFSEATITDGHVVFPDPDFEPNVPTTYVATLAQQIQSQHARSHS